MFRKLIPLLVALTALIGVQGQEKANFEPLQNQLGRNQKDFDQIRGGRGGPRGPAFNVGGPGIHEPFTPPITAAKIRTAIDDAVFYLRSQQAPQGNIGDEGTTVLATLTLLAAGADPAADDGLKKALDWLAKQQPNNTYIRGIRANVWEYALRKLPDDPQFKKMLKVDYEWL